MIFLSWRSLMNKFASSKQHPTRKQQYNDEYILLTYRSGIQKIFSSTYYDSDAGWGCMLRVGQMFVANLYYKIENKPSQEVIRLFYDNEPVAFSLPMITDVACIIYPHKKQYQWFSPCECGFIIKDLLDRFDLKYRTTICNDNCIFLNEIQQDREMLVIMVMCRIGLDEPQPEYLNCVLALMGNPYFNSILGGTPKHAHLFLKYSDGYLGFLDPHRTQKVPPYESLKQKQSEFISKLQWIKAQRIDCSMALVFVVPQKQIKQFWQSLLKTKKELGQSFFIYLKQQRPIYDPNQVGIFEITDDWEEVLKNNSNQEQQQDKNASQPISKQGGKSQN